MRHIHGKEHALIQDPVGLLRKSKLAENTKQQVMQQNGARPLLASAPDFLMVKQRNHINAAGPLCLYHCRGKGCTGGQVIQSRT